MPNCKELAYLIASGELQEKAWTQQMGIRMHLLMCRHCKRYFDQILTLCRAGADLWQGSPTDEEKESAARVLGRLDSLLPPHPTR